MVFGGNIIHGKSLTDAYWDLPGTHLINLFNGISDISDDVRLFRECLSLNDVHRHGQNSDQL